MQKRDKIVVKIQADIGYAGKPHHGVHTGQVYGENKVADGAPQTTRNNGTRITAATPASRPMSKNLYIGSLRQKMGLVSNTASTQQQAFRAKRVSV